MVMKILYCMSLIPQIKKNEYENNGFTIIPNLIPEHVIEVILNAIFNLFKKYDPVGANKCVGQRPWLSQEFHDGLKQLQDDQPKLFSKLYDSLQTNSKILGIGLMDEILTTASELLKKPNQHLMPCDLSSSVTLFRMDAPQKNIHTLGWHQEQVSYNQNDDGSNGLVVWAPLQKVDPKLGTLYVCIGSHKIGFIEPTLTGSYGQLANEKKFVDDETAKEHEQDGVVMNAGDVLFVNMLTLHRSGDMSNANKFRFTITARLHNAFSNDFNPGRLRFIPSN